MNSLPKNNSWQPEDQPCSNQSNSTFISLNFIFLVMEVLRSALNIYQIFPFINVYGSGFTNYPKVFDDHQDNDKPNWSDFAATYLDCFTKLV